MQWYIDNLDSILRRCNGRVDLLSFPTRRSSDLRLLVQHMMLLVSTLSTRTTSNHVLLLPGHPQHVVGSRSEEHTLNSSHGYISYAVFCLKKKTIPKLLPPIIYRRSSDWMLTSNC